MSLLFVTLFSLLILFILLIFFVLALGSLSMGYLDHMVVTIVFRLGSQPVRGLVLLVIARLALFAWAFSRWGV
jgi:hypothetical protein